ncbi:adenosylmethionine decarboxylase [Vallitalea okinawensis]|uniref:adenosylmethionine decarboxylase n=1 Tax=Vallitalea okinawensis TaxID=2078660 RepID=UPI000CFD3E38|nr:adenosylmethionine decarboxylase [Vallitalea okinawensis]
MQNQKLRLYGFNNLTKSLSFNIYDICYAKTVEDRKSYIEYIDEQYNSERLTNILRDVTNTIGASILNISKQDYDPQGASVTILISEEEVPLFAIDQSCNKGIITPIPDTVVAHLDKSHLTVHTYPESHPYSGLSTFRVDIDVSTCGEISPLKALEALINSFDSDIITVDYKVRGFTRDTDGTKHFIDHKITSIQDYIPEEIKQNYNMIDTNVYQEKIFHTKMQLKNFKLDDYLFNIQASDLTDEEKSHISSLIRLEMDEIFYGRNFE